MHRITFYSTTFITKRMSLFPHSKTRQHHGNRRKHANGLRKLGSQVQTTNQYSSKPRRFSLHINLPIFVDTAPPCCYFNLHDTYHVVESLMALGNQLKGFGPVQRSRPKYPASTWLRILRARRYRRLRQPQI